jgi:ATP-dependent Clp protease ATP-binding subunit ClpC
LERFTPRARAVLQGARAEARGLGHPYVGTEHLLLALFGDPDSIAAKVLSDLSMTRAQVEDDIVGITPRGSSTNDQPPFTPRAATCLEQTLNEALALGHNYIGTEHMLLGLLTDTEGFAARILIQRGATYEDVRERVIGKLANFVHTKKS